MSTKNRRSLLALFVFAVVWPIAYQMFFHERIGRRLHPATTSVDELQKLLNAKRYTVKIPNGFDGRLLSLQPYVDGQLASKSGGASVRGGTEIVLLVRKDQQTRKVEYCWMDDAGGVSWSVVDDPLKGSAISTVRPEGPIEDGDWIYRGGRERVRGYPSSDPADFELRLALKE